MKSRLIGTVYASIAILFGTTSNQCAAAPVFYDYVGNPYTFATDPYTTDMFVTARIELDDFLPAGLDFADITGLGGFAVTISDGLNTLQSTSPTVRVIDVLVTTDNGGAILEWFVGVAQVNVSGPHIATQFAPRTAFITGDFASHDEIAATANVLDNPGIWSVVPIPSAVWLFGSGLLGLIGIARRKEAA